MKRNLKTVAELVDETPFTHDQIRWFLAKANDNGLAKASAVIRLGRRVYIDADAFDRWLDSKQQVAA